MKCEKTFNSKKTENEKNKYSKRHIAKIGRILAAALLLILIMFSFSGCGEIKVTQPLGSGSILEINNTRCSMGVAMLRLLEVKEQYETMEDDILWLREIGDVTMADYVKNSVKDELLRYTAAQIMADDLTIFLNETEVEKAESDAEALMSRLGEKYNLSSYGITEDDAVDLYKKRTFYEKVYYKVSENITLEISEADTKVIEVNYVLLPSDTALSDVEELRSALKDSSDFRGTCEAYGYDASMAKTIKKGDISDEFDAVAYALRDDEISEVVQTKEGYYIIQCVEDYMVTESTANNNEIISNARREKFEEAYEEFAAESKMRFNNEAWNKINVATLS